MIPKAIKGKGFRGALEYDLHKEQGAPDRQVTIGQRGRQLGEQFQKETQAATASLEKASTKAHFAADRLAESSRRSIWSIHLGALATGLTSAVLVSVFWLWLAPRTISNTVDVGEIVRQLKPEIAAMKRSKGK